MQKTVWLDTNFLLIPVQFHVDIFEELQRIMEAQYELCVPSGVVNELKAIGGTHKRDAAAAKAGLALLERRAVKVVESAGPVDDWLFVKAAAGDIVCTNDIGLIRRLRERDIRRVQLKGKSQLGFVD